MSSEPPTPSAIPPTPTESPEDNSLHDVIFQTTHLRVTFRFARLVALWWLSTLTLGACFWIVLDPKTGVQIDTAATQLAVTIVTAWITAVATGGASDH